MVWILTSNRGNSRIDRSMLIMYKVFDPQVDHTLPLFDIPDSGRLVPRSRNEEPAITRKVERVDFLHVPLEEMADSFLFNVPDLARVSAMCLIKIPGRGIRLTLICLSSAPVAKYFPSGLKQILRMYRSPARLFVSSSSTLRCVSSAQSPSSAATREVE